MSGFMPLLNRVMLRIYCCCVPGWPVVSSSTGEPSVETSHEKMVPLADKVAYGIGNLATGVAMQVLGTYLVFYATAIHGLPGSFVGMAMGLSILWDAITDPVMGHLSDRTDSRRLGSRHPYLLVGALGIALTNYLIWTIDAALSPGLKLFLIAVYIILFKTFMTVYVTPYTALGAELSTDYNERTSIQGIKTVFFVLGLAFVSVAGLFWYFRPTTLYPAGQLNPEAYSFMGLASSILVMVSALACFIPTLKYVEPIRRRTRPVGGAVMPGLKGSLAHAFRNKPFRMVVYGYMFSNMASALLANLGLIVFTYTFGLGSRQIAFVIGIQFLCAMVSQSLWAALSRRTGKMPALVLGFGLSILGSVYFTVLVFFHESLQGNFLVFIPFALTVGSGIGALFTLPLSMVSDTVDLEEAGGGVRLEGLYFGTLTFVYKLSQAAVLVLIGLLIDILGFNALLASQLENTMISLGLVLSLGSIAAFTGAILAIRNYPLTEAVVSGYRTDIAARKRAAILSRL
jgi:glycoside/pentoside/hexuronide:cation symporter, GPH family